MYALFQPTDDLHGAIHHAGNDHMKTVRTEVDRRELLRPGVLSCIGIALVRLLE
ncbi:Uncharacterised protein [Citrobacter koseri]|uniref:Uncharacterized protein n=1 Tax=Citrobacter koseri TaxID=545 RepID=A0A2X2VID9_CITKO|nr:Uncharacterised protein [Citrobacter koseri]SUX84508.1 Uncharacterised protein [Citrobacter koseri]